MFDMPDIYNALESDDLTPEQQSSPLRSVFTLATFLSLAYGLIRYAEHTNRLDYDNRLTRIIAGFLHLSIKTFHAQKGALDLPKDEATLIVAGPHRTSWEASVLTSKMEGTPPRILTNDGFNSIPGVAQLLTMFKTIPVKLNPEKTHANRSPNSSALDTAAEVLKEKGSVALFPQGRFAYIGKAPPIIYSGAAILAIRTNTPIHVIRLDGFWSLENPVIPLFVRNNRYYRAFLSAFHMNNVQTNLCRVINFHLDPKNDHLSEEEKIQEINAQLYAFYRHTEELAPADINHINQEIAQGKHRAVWENKFSQHLVEKQLKKLKDEYKTLEDANYPSVENQPTPSSCTIS